MKNTIKGTNSTLDYAEEWISDMEDKIVKITQLQQQREKNNTVVHFIIEDIECLEFRCHT